MKWSTVKRSIPVFRANIKKLQMLVFTCEEMAWNGVAPAMPRGPITVTWPEAGRLPLEAQFALALLPGCSLGTARRNRAEGPPRVHVSSWASCDYKGTSCHRNCHVRKLSDKIIASRKRTSSCCWGSSQWLLVEIWTRNSPWVWLIKKKWTSLGCKA